LSFTILEGVPSKASRSREGLTVGRRKINGKDLKVGPSGQLWKVETYYIL